MKINFKSFQMAGALAIVAVAMLAFAATCGGSEPEDLIFNVTIEHDGWDVADDVIKVKQGDHVTVNVESDVQGGFHLHGYDLYNEVGPGAPMSFYFVADATGNFGIQFHKFPIAADDHAPDDHAADGHEDEAAMDLDLGSLQVFPR